MPYLIPLPEKPYDTAEVVYRTVNGEGLVAYRQNFYSVPWRHLGEILPLRITEEELIVYGPNLEVITRHPLLPRTATGQRSELPEHRPQEDTRRREAHLRARFAELGSAASRFLEGLLRTHRMGKDQASRVLALLETYRKQDRIFALERAVQFGAFSLRCVERILAAQAQPKTALESLADHSLHERLRYYTTFDLLVIDEFGFDRIVVATAIKLKIEGRSYRAHGVKEAIPAEMPPVKPQRKTARRVPDPLLCPALLSPRAFLHFRDTRSCPLSISRRYATRYQWSRCLSS